MDCSKVGKLILALRKEKNMTQLELAEKVQVSDRAVSKWERGHGCPDVTLLGKLSEILGVNIETILSGEIEMNLNQSANIRKIKFYHCPNCNNILFSFSDAEIFCCGRKTEALTFQNADDKHNAQISETEDELFISISHEMTKEHYISFAAHVLSDSITVKKLYPEQQAEFRIQNKCGGELYIFCTVHGLLKIKL